MAPRKLPERKEVAAEHQWDLTPLFDADEKWEALFSETETDLDGYLPFRGRIGESAAVLREAIEFDLSVSRKIERLYWVWENITCSWDMDTPAKRRKRQNIF